MQLHAWLEAAPALGRGSLNTRIMRMQNHALYACMRSLRQASQKKAGFGRAVESKKPHPGKRCGVINQCG